MLDLLDKIVFGNSVRSWLAALGVGVIGLLVLRVAITAFTTRLAALAKHTATEWDDVVVIALGRTKGWTLAVLALYAATLPLELPPRVRAIAHGAAAVALLVQIGIWAVAALGGWLDLYRARRLAEDPGSVTMLSTAGFVGKLAVWAAVVLLALQNAGVNITALVAGLGVGGVALALAVQNILGDLFASLSIVLDKPFVIGDFVTVGQEMGTVENVGLKTTRVRSLSGEQLVFANSDLLKSRIRNFGRMNERRVVFAIGVTYQTPRAKLAEIPAILREAVESQDRTRFDRAHFKEYGAYALDFEVVYYVLDRDYNLYMDIQQAINLRIHERFETEGIEFAFPTQTIFVEREAGEA